MKLITKVSMWELNKHSSFLKDLNHNQLNPQINQATDSVGRGASAVCHSQELGAVRTGELCWVKNILYSVRFRI